MYLQKVRQVLANPFNRNVGWLGLAEVCNRLFRLGTTITLARVFSLYDYGLMSIIFTVQSFSEVLSSGSGIGTAIIQIDDKNLEETCNTAYCLNWMLYTVIAVTQCLLAYPVARLFGDDQLAVPICVASLKYLVIPVYKVQSALIQRENRLKIAAISQVAQSLISNILTIVLVLLGFGIWAIVWAMVCSVGARVVVNHWNHSWRPPHQIQLKRWREVSHYGSNILGARLLDKLRLNLDYLLVGQFLGLEVLGLYYFAFNAGIGISRNLIQVFTKSLFPYLCQSQGDFAEIATRYQRSVRTMARVIVPFVLIQSGLAFFYVPVVFGEKWIDAIPILSIVCLSAIPLSLTQANFQLLNAIGQVRVNLYWSVAYTLIFLLALLISVQYGLLAVSLGVLSCALLFCLNLFIISRRLFWNFISLEQSN